MPWKPNAPYTACEVMAHEWVHMKDGKAFGPLFKFLYLFPQILAPLAVLAFWKWWMIFDGVRLLKDVRLLALRNFSEGYAYSRVYGYSVGQIRVTLS